MSINYHAFQNKGFLLSGFEVICNQWRADFTGFDPERAAEILKLEYDADYVYVIYYGETFRLRRKDGVLERKLEEGQVNEANTAREDLQKPSGAHHLPRSSSYLGTDSAFREDAFDLETAGRFTQSAEPGWSEDVYFNESMALYHYLKDAKDHPGFAGVWIPNYSLDPRAVRKKDFLGAAFAKNVAGRTELLEAVCREKGGREVPTKADLGFEFDAFKEVPVQIHYYEEDDDFPAQVQMLVDRQVTDYLNLECTGCLFADLFDRLEQAMKAKDGQA